MRFKVVIALLLLASCQSTGVRQGLADEPSASEIDITVVRDLRYRDGVSKHCTLDVATPRDAGAKPRPAILVIHGGGWIEGDKSSFATEKDRVPGSILDFTKRGFVGVGVNYRMSGEAPFPVALDDCRCAVRWLRAHANEHHIDVDHIGAYGNSAGGHLALLLAMMPAPTALDKNEPYGEQSSQVQAAACDSGPLDLAAQHAQNQLRVVIEKFMGGPPEGARLADYRRASPVSYASSANKLPPLLLMYGESDTQVNVNLTDEFVAALSRAGHKDLSYFRLAGVDHCPHSLIRIPFLRGVVEEFFIRTLKPAAP